MKLSTFILTLLLFFLVIGWSMFVWGKYKPQKTPTEIYQKLYENCIRSQFINNRDINDCNDIKYFD